MVLMYSKSLKQLAKDEKSHNHNIVNTNGNYA